MTDTPQWVDKYRPETLDDVQGNNSDLDDIKHWADNWSTGDSPLLLIGLPGVGKTSTAEAVANRLGLDVVEVNASSARSTDDLENMATQIVAVGPDGHRLVIVDEVDSWHHAPSKQVLYDALDNPGNPVICTANDEWSVPDGLKRRCEKFEFSLGVRSRKAKLRSIAEAEGIELTSQALSSLADRPDLRSAINDLEMYAEEDGPVSADQRVWEDEEWDVLDRLLSGTPDVGSMSPPDALMWIDECVSAEYRGLEMAMAHEALAMADVQLGKAQRHDYRHWKYAKALIEEVALIRQTEPYYEDQISYRAKNFPEWFRHSKVKADSEHPEAKLYRSLDLQRGFQLFREAQLPILQDLDPEDKYQLVLSNGLDSDEMDVLGVSESDYEDWLEVEEPEEGEWQGKVQSATEW